MTTYLTPGGPGRAEAPLVETWLGHVAAEPDRPAIHTEATGWVTHGRLDADSRAVLGRFRAAGLAPGDRILFSCATSYDLVVAHVAALRGGYVVIPANTAYTAPELAHLATDGEIAALVIDDDERASWVTAARPDAVRFAPGRFEPGDVGEDRVVTMEDPAMIGYTSGTTGRPKGAQLSHGNLAASSAAVAHTWGWTERDRLVLCLPLFHAHGLGVGLHGTLFTGGSAVLQSGFSTDAVLAAIGEHEATMFFGVPTMYERLLAAPDLEALARLRLCVSGSAALSAATWEALRERTGQPVLERYGMTETLMLVSNPGDGERRPGTVGLPLPGIEARIDAEPGVVGEICVRGSSVFSGYWKRPDATAEAFTDDGWFRTGDLGETDEAGYLRIVGRSKELIISGGYNVYPREVEDAITAHPDVTEAAVVGVPSQEWGETVTAHVVLRDGAEWDESMLAAFLEDRLAPYKRPRAWRRAAALPRNAMGKVVRGELAP